MAFDTDHTFTDRQGRLIALETSGDIVAHVNGKEIGRVQFDEGDDGPFLFHMAVDPAYRRAGIATEMIRLAAQQYGRRFGRPSFLAVGGSGRQSSDYFTQEGARLIRHCIEEGIIEDIPDSAGRLEDWKC